MTTAHSPLHKLKAQSDKMASILKISSITDPKKGSITFAVLMDDKILKITMPWDKIREDSEENISSFILQEMQK